MIACHCFMNERGRVVKFRHVVLVLSVTLLLTATASAQGQTPGGTSTGQPAGGQIGGAPSSRGGGVNLGAPQVPGAARVSTGPSALSLDQAIQLAIQNNLATLLARERRREAEGVRQELLAGLLPNISAAAYQANITQNLAALGFQPSTFPGIRSTFIGPFNNFDARARLVQTIFSLSAIKNYQAGRAGVHIAELEEQLAREQVASGTALVYLEALRAELLPSLEFVGDYGVSGITPTNTDLPTRRVAIQLNVPVFNGGLTNGRIAVAASRERQAELELGSVRGQVEEDVRLALSNIRTTAAEVRAANESVQLAERELAMARDRFRAGVADNLEVINAQTALANARDAQVAAITQYNAARLNLAAALGRAETFRW